jgi:hypothetical protein
MRTPVKKMARYFKKKTPDYPLANTIAGPTLLNEGGFFIFLDGKYHVN